MTRNLENFPEATRQRRAPFFMLAGHAVWLSAVGFGCLPQKGTEMPKTVSRMVTDRSERARNLFVKMRVNHDVDLPFLAQRQLIFVGCGFLGVRFAVGKGTRMLDLHFGN